MDRSATAVIRCTPRTRKTRVAGDQILGPDAVRVLDQRCGVLTRAEPDILPTEHSGQFLDPLLFVQRLHARHGPAILGMFFHPKMAIREGCDLRQMRDTQHLMCAGRPRQPTADGLRHDPPDSSVDFIEDVCHHPVAS